MNIIKQCNYCEKEFGTTEYLRSIGKGKFCGRKCVDKFQIGGKLSEATKNKIGFSNIGKHKLTIKQREKISKANKGKKISEETKEKIRKARKNQINTNKGMKWKIKDTSKMKGRCGEKSGTWKGGITIVNKLIRRMPEYKKWRSDVFQRDNWTCKTCNEDGCYVEVHHKKAFSKIIKENNIKTTLDARKCKELWNSSNGVTLCKECHTLTDNYGGNSINNNK